MASSIAASIWHQPFVASMNMLDSPCMKLGVSATVTIGMGRWAVSHLAPTVGYRHDHERFKLYVVRGFLNGDHWNGRESCRPFGINRFLLLWSRDTPLVCSQKFPQWCSNQCNWFGVAMICHHNNLKFDYVKLCGTTHHYTHSLNYLPWNYWLHFISYPWMHIIILHDYKVNFIDLRVVRIIFIALQA